MSARRDGKAKYEYDAQARAKAVSMVIDEGKTSKEASEVTGVPAAAIPALVGVERQRNRKQLGTEYAKKPKGPAVHGISKMVSYLTSTTIQRFTAETFDVQDSLRKIHSSTSSAKGYLSEEVGAFLSEADEIQQAITLLQRYHPA